MNAPRLMLTACFATIAAVALLVLTAPTAHACSCIETKPPLDELARVDAVFAGQVTSIEESPPRADGTISSADPTTVTLTVDEIWKGPVVETIAVTTEREEDSCGYDFVVGGRYLVYAIDLENFDHGLYVDQSGLYTNLCSRTRLLDAADEDLATLGEGQVPIGPINDLFDWLRALLRSVTVISTAPPAAPVDLAFPTDQFAKAYTPRGSDDALLNGTLADVHGCLGVVNQSATDGIVVIWPPEYLFDAAVDPPTIRDRATGEPVAQLGDRVALTGGYRYLDRAREVAVDSLLDSCALPVAEGDNFFLAAPSMQVNGQRVGATSPFPTVALVTDGEPTRPVHGGERVPSPHGDWMAEVRTDWPTDDSTPFDGFYVELRIASADGGVEYLPLAEQRGYGLGFIIPGIIGWSPSGRYLYFTERPHPDGCAIFADASGLWRFDVQSGGVEMLFDSGGTVSLSPDGLRAATITVGTNDLTLLDLRSGARHIVEIDMAPQRDQAGGIVWSPDGQSLALTMAHGACSNRWTQSIVRVNVADDRRRTTEDGVPLATALIERDERLLTTIAWHEADAITVGDSEGRLYLVNTRSGALTSIELPVVYEEPELPLPALPTPGIERRENAVEAPAAPVAHPVPEGICNNVFNSLECARTVEGNQLRAGVPQIKRNESTGQLLLTLSNGDVLAFTDDEHQGPSFEHAAFTYRQYLPELDHHVLHVQYWQGRSYLLVDAQTGAQTLIDGLPIVAPDSRHFFTTFNLFESPLHVTTWRVEGDKLQHEQTLRFSVLDVPGPVGPIKSATWANANRIEVEIKEVYHLDAPGGTIAIEVGDDDPTRITFNGVRMERPALDPWWVAYENDAIAEVGTAAVGEPLYADRDYVFTQLPFLQNTPYLLFFNDNLHNASSDYARFYLYRPATLYVAIYAEACDLPGWLSEWEPVGAVIETSDLPLALYRRDFEAGEVVLGGNAMSPAACVRSHYVIFVAAN